MLRGWLPLGALLLAACGSGSVMVGTSGTTSGSGASSSGSTSSSSTSSSSSSSSGQPPPGVYVKLTGGRKNGPKSFSYELRELLLRAAGQPFLAGNSKRFVLTKRNSSGVAFSGKGCARGAAPRVT